MEHRILDIFRYTDYRRYLRDFYQEKKAVSRAFSFQTFARKAGIASSSYLHHVMNGERNLTKPMLLKVAQAVGLNRPQTEYFADLVACDQAKTQAEKDFFFGKTMALRQSARVKNLEDSQYEFFAAWYNSVVRELVPLMPPGSSPAALAKKVIPGVTAAQVKRSLQLMEQLGILRKDEAGNYVQSEPFIAHAPARNLAIIRFQKSMLEIAGRAWEHFPENDILMTTMTFTASEELMPKVFAEIREFKKRILTLVRNDPRRATRVHHINLHCFPTSKTVEVGA